MSLKAPRSQCSLCLGTRHPDAPVHRVLTEPMNLRQRGHFRVLTTCRHASGPLCGTPREATQGTELCLSLAERGEVAARPPLSAAPLPGEGSGHCAYRQSVLGCAGGCGAVQADPLWAAPTVLCEPPGR